MATAADQNPAVGDAFYPPLEPYRRGFLGVGYDQEIYFEESGNPAGFPVVFVHGGPGSQSRPAHRRFFDPGLFRIILFDQRGCGQSKPLGSLADNTTAHLVDDLDLLRRHLGVDRWLLFGGSWGSTLCLAYSQAYPERVAGLVLRGIFLGSDAEVDWFLNGVRRIVPEAWTEFSRGTSGSLVEHYQRLLNDPRIDSALAAAKSWSDYEARVMEPANATASANTPSPRDNLAAVQVQLHYLVNKFFLKPDELLDNLWRIRDKPVTIVQGRMDLVCPPVTAIALANGISGSRLQLVACGGHSALQREMAAELCAATRDMHTRIG